MKLGHLNRHKKIKPKSNHAFYCGCDRNKVRLNEKCSVCGHKEESKHNFPASRNLIDYHDYIDCFKEE